MSRRHSEPKECVSGFVGLYILKAEVIQIQQIDIFYYAMVFGQFKLVICLSFRPIMHFILDYGFEAGASQVD